MKRNYLMCFSMLLMLAATVAGADFESASQPGIDDAAVPWEEVTDCKHSYWTAVIPGATWIWTSDPIVDPVSETHGLYTIKLDLCDSATGTLEIAADNSYDVKLDGTTVICADSSEWNFVKTDNPDAVADPLDGYNPDGLHGGLQDKCDVTIPAGEHTVTIDVKNLAQSGGSCSSNPGGLMYLLQLDYDSTDADTDGSSVCDDCNDADKTIYPDAPEICDIKDNDCDQSVDEGLTQPTSCGLGECAGNVGIETCTDGVWGGNTCDPLDGTTAEDCDGLDNDCDGTIDEAITDDCYEGPDGTEDVGICKAGTETCEVGGTGTWGECVGQVLPADSEVWGNGQDDDCNGATDCEEDTAPRTDADGDGVEACADLCWGTESDAPLDEKLGTNRYVWYGPGDQFSTLKPKAAQSSFTSAYTLTVTNGCSCKQILQVLPNYDPAVFGEMVGHWKYGCSKSVMDEFINECVAPEGICPGLDQEGGEEVCLDLSGEWLLDFTYGGHWLHDVSLTQDGCTLSGTGGYPAGGPYSPIEEYTGSATATGIELHSLYTTGVNTGYTYDATGSLGLDGKITGTIVSSQSQTGPFVMTRVP